MASHNKLVTEGLPIEQPPGEDFFLANVIIDNPDDPCWDDGFSLIDPWEAVTRTISQYLALDPRAARSRVRLYQGQDAGSLLIAGVREELRYQEQKRVQPNN